MKQIVINATVAREAGALTVLKQLCTALSQYNGEDMFTVFHYPGLDLPMGERVRYLPVEGTNKWLKRIFWDLSGLAKRCANVGIKPDVVLSMQNTGMGRLGDIPQVIYLHQPLPFTPDIRFSPFKDPKLFFYRHVYKRMIKATIPKDARIIVQTEWMKDGVIKVLGFPEAQIYMMKPDIPAIPDALLAEPTQKQDELFEMFFPAMSLTYKNHRILIEAMGIIKREHPDVYPNLRIRFTLKPDELELPTEVAASFIMEGYMEHDNLLACLAASDAMLFPSYVETFGMPLLEGAAFGLPILAADLPYSRDVLKHYGGASYLPHTDAAAWANAVIQLYNERPRYERLPMGEKSDYNALLQLLTDTAAQHQ